MEVYTGSKMALRLYGFCKIKKSIYGYEKFFGRSEVMQLLGITASPASALIKKMVNSGIIYPIKGKGKGKYLFR